MDGWVAAVCVRGYKPHEVFRGAVRSFPDQRVKPNAHVRMSETATGTIVCACVSVRVLVLKGNHKDKSNDRVLPKQKHTQSESIKTWQSGLYPNILAKGRLLILNLRKAM